MTATIGRTEITPQRAIESRLDKRTLDFFVEVSYDIDRQVYFLFALKDGLCWRAEFSCLEWARNRHRPYEFADDALDKLENSNVLALSCCTQPIGIIRQGIETLAQSLTQTLQSRVGEDFYCWSEIEYDRNRRSAVGWVSVGPDIEVREFVKKEYEWMWPQKQFEVAAGETTLIAIGSAVTKAFQATIPFFESHVEKCRQSQQWQKIKRLIAIKQGK